MLLESDLSMLLVKSCGTWLGTVDRVRTNIIGKSDDLFILELAS